MDFGELFVDPETDINVHSLSRGDFIFLDFERLPSLVSSVLRINRVSTRQDLQTE